MSIPQERMLVPKVQLIPSGEQVLELLRETGALREGRFQYKNGLQAQYYFQMPLMMRYHGNARVLNVALSRKFRKEPEVLAALPNCAVVAPSPGGAIGFPLGSVDRILEVALLVAGDADRPVGVKHANEAQSGLLHHDDHCFLPFRRRFALDAARLINDTFEQPAHRSGVERTF